MKKGRHRWRIVCYALIVLTLAFIWSRSFKSIPESRAESLSVLEFLKPLLCVLLGGRTVTNHMIRKAAHFCEFGLLGVELGVLCPPQVGRRLPVVLGIGFLCGAVDETIQSFTGRGNQFSDVLLDFSGFAVGALGILALLGIAAHFRKKTCE